MIKINRQQINHILSENQKTLSLLLVGVIYVILGAIFPWSTDGYQIMKGVDIRIDPLYSDNYSVLIRAMPVSISIVVISLIALFISSYSLLILHTKRLRTLNLLFGGVILYLAFYEFQLLKLALFERGIVISAPFNPGFVFTFLGGLIIFANGLIFLLPFLKKLSTRPIRSQRSHP